MEDIDRFNLPRREWENLIDQWIIGKNSERDRAIIKRRLLDGIRFELLAEEFDMSDRQIKTIVYKTTQKIIKHI